jgi:acyl-CoA synthetase (AMP-forming)/AMP-acid ligase II
MSCTELSAPLTACASSLLPDRRLPDGDRRFWSHSVTDLVAGFLRDGDCSRIAEVGGRSLQRQEVEDAVARLRALDLGAGDVIVVQVYNEVTAVVALLAAWLNACCVCPVDPDTPPEVQSMIAREARAKAIVRADGEIELLPQEAGSEPLQRRLIRFRRPARVTGVDLAMVIFTSGSSGQPKGVMLSHQNVMVALRSLSSYLGLREDDHILSIPPLFFDYGLYQLLLTLFDGCSLALNGRQTSVVMLLKQVEQRSPTVLPMVPALASGLARMFTTVGKSAPSVRLVTNTGGHLSDKTIEELGQAFPDARIMPMYGLTECKRAMYLDRERYPGRNASVGRAMPGMEAVVVVHEGEESPRLAQPSEVGELYVRGPSVMQGYHRNDACGGARIEAGIYRDDNWLATGDLFSMDDDGLAYFRGRSKMLIKQGGYCIYPRDLEAMAEGLAEIVTARVVARQEANGDESAVLFAQVDPAMTREQRKHLLEQIKQVIPRTLMPRDVRFVHDWPATPNGKIDAAALASLATKPHSAGA